MKDRYLKLQSKRHREARRKPNRRRPLATEALEARHLLTTLGLGVEFHEVGGTQAVSYLEVGKTYEVSVVVQAINASASDVGVISLPLSYSWDPLVMGLSGDSANELDGATFPLTGTAVSSNLLTNQFPLQRSIGNYRPDAGKLDPDSASYLDQFNLVSLRGGALPNLGGAGFGSAIGIGASQAFTPAMEFTLDDNASQYAFTTFSIGLAGSMSFSDASVLDSIVGIGNHTEVLDLPNSIDAQVVRTTIPIAIEGTKREFEADAGALTVPPSPVTFQLDLGADGTFEDSTVTDAAGEFQFVLPPSAWPTTPDATTSFAIQETTPDGRVFYSPADGRFTLNVDGNGKMQVVSPTGFSPPLAFVNQVILNPRGVQGLKFQDRTDTGTVGVYDSGIDSPLTGVTIGLDWNNDGTLDASTSTNASGVYSFDNLPQGTHRVYELSDARQSFPVQSDGTPDSYLVLVAGNTVSVVTESNNANADASAMNFGNLAASIQGTKWIDSVDAGTPGAFDSADMPQAGVTIELDLNNDGVVDQTTVTDSQGMYRFENLAIGRHRVAEVVPAGYRSVLPSGGAYEFTVNPDQTVVGADRFDFLNQITSDIGDASQSVSGYVFNDTNLNGIRDADEMGLPGVSIRLVSSIAGVATRATVTGPDGWYYFADVTPGTYAIEEIQPAGYIDTSASLGTVIPGGTAIGSATSMNRIAGIVVGNGQHALDYNFGEVFSRITKRNLLVQSNSVSLATDSLGIHTMELLGTPGDDAVSIQRMNSVWRVEINGQSSTVPLSDRLVFDSLGGNDTVEIIAGSGDEFMHGQRDAVAITVDPARGAGVVVRHTETVIVDGRLGNDVAVIEGRDGVDRLVAAGDGVSFRYSDASAPNIDLLSFDAVTAINPDDEGTADQAQISAIDFVLDLVGKWTQ